VEPIIARHVATPFGGTPQDKENSNFQVFQRTAIGLLPDLLVFLATFGSVDYVLRLIDFCIRNVPKENHVLTAMEEALKIIIAEQTRDYDWDEPRRDFEGSDYQAASALLREVRALHDR
jgi:hypothetical protein